ncbi:hypothetical protein [Pseudobacillus badius]|uniref:hypothetical protein n=1 Tax=Bacillus badius TaxID=1455 RepID=UPI0007B09808|nr:hypothetical protein [Bacillus badius]KZO00496.1 hypothetical protein A4244_15625 [Bacillus badius]KZR57186.1 hypothetical protein A3781_20130 [Bacillus badius]OCS87076.1 hypothetical protein A6M11_15640 [Bacillus badius]OVE46295.1 hypothetical protein B1A98_19615 [Bacillus badius]TDV97900.1 uncharacterized protein DUF3139 [Bacillus badius]
MSPTTIIELGMLISVVLVLSLLAHLFPKKSRKVIWIIAGLLLVGGITFYSTRPFIVQYQTHEAIEELNKYLTKKYPNDNWRITDKDEVEIRPVVYLHVIFESEPKVVYEYGVKDSNIEQVYILAANSKIMPQHNEGGEKNY